MAASSLLSTNELDTRWIARYAGENNGRSIIIVNVGHPLDRCQYVFRNTDR